jgi:hypothetical protein
MTTWLISGSAASAGGVRGGLALGLAAESGLCSDPMLMAEGAVGTGTVVWDSAPAAAMDQIKREALTANQASARKSRRARPTALIALPLELAFDFRHTCDSSQADAGDTFLQAHKLHPFRHRRTGYFRQCDECPR